ncbi:MAG: hypothetical protein J0L82_15375 [Deltaproteobacteria bacterium]|nr:hypothetical protein [Deltaproteobacteria bacterium]
MNEYTLNGARVEQAGEHLAASFVFEMEAYPEAKMLAADELRALHCRLNSWACVGAEIGSSETRAHQNALKRIF